VRRLLSEALRGLHWNSGGRGAIGYRHVPSDITVICECLPDVPVRHFYEEALAEFPRQLRERVSSRATMWTGADAGPPSPGQPR
jgi:hypothetical protein